MPTYNRVLDTRRFLSQGTTRHKALFGGESGSDILFSPHGAPIGK